MHQQEIEESCRAGRELCNTKNQCHNGWDCANEMLQVSHFNQQCVKCSSDMMRVPVAIRSRKVRDVNRIAMDQASLMNQQEKTESCFVGREVCNTKGHCFNAMHCANDRILVSHFVQQCVNCIPGKIRVSLVNRPCNACIDAGHRPSRKEETSLGYFHMTRVLVKEVIRIVAFG